MTTQTTYPPLPIDIDTLANIIRAVDGSNTLGAGALAEQIVAMLPQRAAPAVPSALEAVARNFEFLAPDADGIVWLALHGHGTTGKAMVRVGEHDRLAAQVALHLENDRREALAASTTAPAVPDVVREVDGGPSAKTPLGAMALRLYAAWAKAEPNHGVTKYPVSYWQTFIDMARAVLSASPAAPSAPDHSGDAAEKVGAPTAQDEYPHTAPASEEDMKVYKGIADNYKASLVAAPTAPAAQTMTPTQPTEPGLYFGKFYPAMEVGVYRISMGRTKSQEDRLEVVGWGWLDSFLEALWSTRIPEPVMSAAKEGEA